MEVLLGTPPPPPPPGVPDLDETETVSDGRMLTTRERMEMHRTNPVCNSCHSFMDPIGLSLDNFDVVTSEGLMGGYEAIRQCLVALETNEILKVSHLCEPKFGERGLYRNISLNYIEPDVKAMTDLVCYSDGKRDLLSIAELIEYPIWQLIPIVEKLKQHNLLFAIEVDS